MPPCHALNRRRRLGGYKQPGLLRSFEYWRQIVDPGDPRSSSHLIKVRLEKARYTREWNI
jgi:hypothetical protein